MLVLAGLIPNSLILRVLLSAGVVLVLVTLLVRISVDVIQATAMPRESATAGLPDNADSCKDLGRPSAD